jgi:hypothetical protein
MRCPRAETSAGEPSRGQGEARVLNALEVLMASSGDPASVSWLDALWLSPPVDLFDWENRETRASAPCLSAPLRY